MMMNNKLGMTLTVMIGIMINRHDEDHHYDHIHIYSFLAALWLINRLPFTPLHPLHPSLNFLDFETRAPVGAKKYDGCSDDDVCAELGSPICFGVGTMLRYQGKSPTLLR